MNTEINHSGLTILRNLLAIHLANRKASFH